MKSEDYMRVALLSICVLMVGCASTTPPIDRESKLLTMAAGEAQQIPDATERLTRQLRFAHQQMQRGNAIESRQSLAYAAQTLRDAKPDDLKPQIRIAGWVSISELSRDVNDYSTAHAACDQAVSVLQALDPVADRPSYVLGVSAEVEALNGRVAASKLLASSANWIEQMPDVQTRRNVLAGITRRILSYDQYDLGLQTLRVEADAAWRSDILAAFADDARQQRITRELNSGGGVLARNPSFIDPSELAPGNNYPLSRPVDYNSVFAGAKGQN